MLKQLTLKNFRKHEDLTVEFSEGLQVIRGANENGKSTLYEAVGYAFWGSRALSEGLDDVVTWGKAAKELQVKLVFDHEGAEYTIVRRKAGAELTGPGVTASGQSEVTSFVEKLFRASASVGAATLLASQGALKDSLDGSSVQLIEKLSNMGLIDELIRKIQDKLPCGNTKALDQQVAAYDQLVLPVLDVVEMQHDHVRATDALVKAEHEFLCTQAYVEDILREAEAASNRISAAQQVQRDRDRLTAEIASLVPVPVPSAPSPTSGELAALKKAQGEAAALRSAWLRFTEAHVAETYEDAAAFALRLTNLSTAIAEATEKMSEAKTSSARLQGMLITSTHCGLCDKDLTDVPEVVAKNSELAQKIAVQDEIVKAQREILDGLMLQKEAAKAVSAASVKIANLRIPFTEVDTTVQPNRLVWAGTEVSSEVDTANYDALISAATAQQAARASAVSRNTVVEEQLNLKKTALEALPALEITKADLDAAQAPIKARAELAEAEAAMQTAKTALRSIDHRIATAKAVYAQQYRAYEEALAMKQKLKDTVALYHFHNTIIDKLRTARPIVARKLWSTVLGGISHYLTIIRGRQSTVSRTDDGFLIDGKGIKSYSGSAKDGLGLAIRIMLQKTFLGSIDMMLLDEAAAACDNTRESDMLGLLSSCGIRQVVLVTHSDLADAFATNVITI